MDRRQFLAGAAAMAGATPGLRGWSAAASSGTQDLASRVAAFASWIEIDLDALGANLRQIRAHTGTEVMPVVKNSAYGHGLLPTVAYLQRQGVRRVFVADFSEAEAIRESGIDVGVVNMGPIFTADDYVRAVRLGITQTVFDVPALEALSRAAATAGRPASVFVKVDTGLRRLGIWHEAAADFVADAARRDRLIVDGLYSSLQQVPEQDRLALQRLLDLRAALRHRGVPHGVCSLASSDAIFHFPEAHLDLVRPGMSLYGIYPEDKDREAGLALRPVLSFKARIEQVKWVNAGDSVTYWGRFVAPTRMALATVHVGFHQVLPRELANQGVVMFQGAPRRMVGSISLNHVIVDVTGASAAVGDVVEVIGKDGPVSASEVAKTAGWMVYSLLNHLSLSTPRVYLEGGVPQTILQTSGV